MPPSPQTGPPEPAAVDPADTAGILKLAAHELRQPLSTIGSIACYLDLVLPSGESRARMQASRLQGLVAQVNGILSDTLHFLQAAPAQPQPTELDGFLRAAGRELAAEGLLFGWSVESRPLWVLADPDQFHHMLRNLLRFCTELAPAGQAPEVRARLAGGRVRLWVSIASPGFGDSVPERIFEPFAPHLPPGMGLGLACARRIAEAHGGSLEAQASPSRLSFTAEFPEASFERTSRRAVSGA